MLTSAIQIYQQAIATLQQDWTGRAYAAMALKAFQLISSIMTAVSRANDAVDELQQAEKIFEEKRELYDVYVDNQNVKTHHDHLQPLLKINSADREK